MKILGMKIMNALGIMAMTVIALSGCSTVREQLGVGRNSPDEFLVVKRAPLSTPPDFTLRAPTHEGLAAASAPADTARNSVLGTGEANAPRGTAEQALLQKLGADAAVPDIRRTIMSEGGFLTLRDPTLAQRLLFWQEHTDPQTGDVVVDPVKEAERLKQNNAQGKPVNDGDVPVIKKRNSIF